MNYDAWDYETYCGLIEKREPTIWDDLKEDIYKERRLEERYESDRLDDLNCGRGNLHSRGDRRQETE